jgi:hypothetical protein
MARIAREGLERVDGALKQQGVDEARTVLSECVERMGQREDDVKVRDRQQLRAAGLDPAGLGQRLALRTVSVAAGVVDGPRGAAAVAALEMAAERRRATGLDRAQRAVLHGRQPVRAPKRLAVSANDRRQPGPACLSSCRRRIERRRRAHGDQLGSVGNRSSGEEWSAKVFWARWK